MRGREDDGARRITYLTAVLLLAKFPDIDTYRTSDIANIPSLLPSAFSSTLPTRYLKTIYFYITLSFLLTFIQTHTPVMSTTTQQQQMEALRTKVVMAIYTITLSTAIYLFCGGSPSQFVLGVYVGSMVTLCGLNFYLYYCCCVPAASSSGAAAAGGEEKG